MKKTALGRITLAIDATNSPVVRGTLREVLDHAGLFVHEVLPGMLPAVLEEPVPQIVLIAGRIDAKTGEALRAPLDAFFARGGGIVALGGTGAPSGQDGQGVVNGLFEVFGLQPAVNPSYVQPGSGQSPWQTLGEGWLKVRDKKHPVLAGMGEVALHVFGGQAVIPAKGKDAAKTLASIVGLDGKARPLAALSERTAKKGKGTAIFVAADLAGSAANIRTGRPVHFDAPSAPDGSAPLSDGLLKAEDGMVLDFLRDRHAIDERGRPAKKAGPNAWPIFDQPIADALAQVLLRAIFHTASRTGVRLPRLWYHPDGLEAIGHISHDTDGNDPDLGELLHKVMEDAGTRSTWCTIHPGYAEPFYEKLKAFGHEIALHYDAMGQPPSHPFRRWGDATFDFQYRWLLDAAKLSGPEALVSNKNHFTRWEGGLEFLEWCVHEGVRIDQSRGPSKRGMIGFPFGSCHAHFMYDVRGRRIDTLELGFQTQDLVVTAPTAWGPMFVERALRWHGVCHLLFHPAHIGKDGVADSLVRSIEHGKKKGLCWMTSREIDAFERARRACVEAGAEWLDDGAVRLRAPKAVAGATLMVLGSEGLEQNGSKAAGKTVRREGFTWSQAPSQNLSGETILR